jgi:hypothetical protein
MLLIESPPLTVLSSTHFSCILIPTILHSGDSQAEYVFNPSRTSTVEKFSQKETMSSQLFGCEHSKRVCRSSENEKMEKRQQAIERCLGRVAWRSFSRPGCGDRDTLTTLLPTTPSFTVTRLHARQRIPSINAGPVESMWFLIRTKGDVT